MSDRTEEQLRDDIAFLRRCAQRARADRHLTDAVKIESVIAAHEKELAALVYPVHKATSRNP